ncbi:MAG TPA: hypothetical protein VF708_16610 [Pyrinomonadaceae bacterium]|jgi:hypothetical protein
MTEPLSTEVTLEKLIYLDLPDCYRLSNGTVEVIVTTAVGPRILRYGFCGEDNILGEVKDDGLETALGQFKPWGGHRLWVAPEAVPGSYAPDNSPIEFEIKSANTIHLMPPPETATGIQKEITVRLDPEGTGVTIRHKIINRHHWTIAASVWALTIMRGGGEAILPQEPYRSHDDYLLPARPLVLWHFTDLSDPRWTIGRRYIRLRTDAARPEPQKIGIMNKQGWAAYHHQETLFVKRFAYQEDATYPDYGSNNETYTAAEFIELESLAPLRCLEPGMAAEHVERWYLFGNVRRGETETEIDEAVRPLIAQTSMRVD